MLQINRRRFLEFGSLGAALLTAPAWGQGGTGFTHGIASGEPGQNEVLLWTRFVSSNPGSKLTAEISTSEDFTHIVSGATVAVRADRDFTAKTMVGGLKPGLWYFYRFVAPDGSRSETGRTRTLPEGDLSQFRLGVFSCSNLPFGFFNAYAHAAARDDIDLMLHLGDYIYEYDRGHYPTPEETVATRIVEPASEAIHLADYRARYASYRRDPNLREIHRRFPMIAMWDDHESANDSSKDGAENHDPATEGSWDARKSGAIRAYREWMPVSDKDWAEYRIGTLATLFRPEERLGARTRQLDLSTAVAGKKDVIAALTAFRDSAWMDPSHTLFGAEQEQWFADRMRTSVRETKWQILAQQVNVGYTHMPEAAANWLPAQAPAVAHDFVALCAAAASAGLPFNMDSWNGYPAARSRMLTNGLDTDANLVVLSGDSHNAWAFDLMEHGTPAGVEFAGQSVTSPGYESSFLGADPLTVARGLVASSPELKWADTSNRGYMTVTLTPNEARAEWIFLDTIIRPSTKVKATHTMSVAHGARRLST